MRRQEPESMFLLDTTDRETEEMSSAVATLFTDYEQARTQLPLFTEATQEALSDTNKSDSMRVY